MEKEENKKIDNIEKLVEVIATNVLKFSEDMVEVKKNMATKDDLINLKLELKTDIHDLRAEFKSFKDDTNESIKKIEEDVTELSDADMLHDKRIEKLENKVFI